jgi:hypothetical protein
MRVFLDTNILLYAVGQDHPQQEACSRVLRRVADGSLEATANTEVVQEILFVLIRRGRPQDGLVLARHVLALFTELLPVTRESMQVACDLLQRFPQLPVRDAIHAATMLDNGIKRIISVDSDFDLVPQIERVEPDAA